MTDHVHRLPGSDRQRDAGADTDEWDDRYAASDQVWSGQPNGALMAEIAGEVPRRALDVGCGEGADAVWMALRGWRVTALDVSAVALDRARNAAGDAGVDIDWLHAGLLDAALPAGGFNLVSAQYPALLLTPGHDAERALLGAVASAGTLLMVHHSDFDIEEAKGTASIRRTMSGQTTCSQPWTKRGTWRSTRRGHATSEQALAHITLMTRCSACVAALEL